MPVEEDIAVRASELGFHAVAIAAVEPLVDDARRLREWLAAGHHAGMEYMERWPEQRRDPAQEGMVPGARSVVCVAMAYPSDSDGEGVLPLIARYARGRDYHDVVRGRLRRLLRYLTERLPGQRGRAFVDTAPVFERAWAARAGIGWVGRNSSVIHARLGSWIVLGELVVTAELEPSPPGVDRCGQCTACVDACPSGALSAPSGRTLDARRCLSYWTVESREPPPGELASSDMLFGCDACQLACPYNEGASSPESPLRPLDRWREVELRHIAEASLAAIEGWTSGTALARAGAEALRDRARSLLREGRAGSTSGR